MFRINLLVLPFVVLFIVFITQIYVEHSNVLTWRAIDKQIDKEFRKCSTFTDATKITDSAVAILVKSIEDSVVEFATILSCYIDVYIVADDNAKNDSEIFSNDKFSVVQYESDTCYKQGFIQSSFSPKILWGMQVNAWDKALLHFSRNQTNHRFVWFMEDDMFVPTAESLMTVHHNYSSRADLVSQPYKTWEDEKGWCHWGSLEQFDLPKKHWKFAMVQAVGMSRALLNIISDFADKHGHLPFIETSFTTLSSINNLRMVSAPELRTLRPEDDWSFSKMKEQGFSNWFHPIKNGAKMKEYHRKLFNVIRTEYQARNSSAYRT